METKIDVDAFIARQLDAWPEAAARFKALENVMTKPAGDFTVQFNPARAVSTAAPVDPVSIAARPCFLCAANRPPQQFALQWEDLEILVNPFPVFPGHLTVASRRHEPQSLAGRASQMRRLSRALPGYTVFFNGARCGASAPDHLHFQAVPSRFMHVSSHYYSYVLPESDSMQPEEIDPMVNMVCTDGVITVIPRRRHRPQCYGRLLVSPACIDLCGTLIAVRADDFDALDADRVQNIISEVTFSEPPVYVGLVADNPVVTPQADGTTRVDGITIGSGFHWQHSGSRRFAGEVLRVGGQLINRVGVEEYLRSVISSEMSATSSLELLKAHAVISRSWLLAQMRATRSRADRGTTVTDPPTEPGEIRRWFDRDDHSLFDVCSDDHCQRYQGVTMVTSPQVDKAVDATRGLVLLSRDGLIADARFSKCCGGAFELFQNCWQPASHSYLVARADCAAPLSLPDLTREEEARRWILSRPDAFCADTPPQVLSQVLNDFDRDSTPDFYRWTVEYSVEQLSELVSRRSGIDFGEILELIPLQRGTSGRIFRLKIVGTRAVRTVGKELMIRRWLSESHLFSSAFVVDRTPSGGFLLRGAGWGHGVGLCQIGAAMMAARGCGFRDILAHYFPSTSIRKLY